MARRRVTGTRGMSSSAIAVPGLGRLTPIARGSRAQRPAHAGHEPRALIHQRWASQVVSGGSSCAIVSRSTPSARLVGYRLQGRDGAPHPRNHRSGGSLETPHGTGERRAREQIDHVVLAEVHEREPEHGA